MTYPILIDNAPSVAKLVTTLSALPCEPPSLYIDIEGTNLSRNGTVAILQIFVMPTEQTYLLDVHKLRGDCFLTRNNAGLCLKSILECETIPKVFFDVRNDSDALYSHFQVRLGGVQDLQLMELAARTFARRYVNDLTKCIEIDVPMSHHERQAWMQVKEKGQQLFSPARGGSYAVFCKRPLDEVIIQYCANDVRILPRLWKQYRPKLSGAWWKKVLDASNDRVKLSQSPFYNPDGANRALGPKDW